MTKNEDKMTNKGAKAPAVLQGQERVTLYSTGYSWTCPTCQYTNREDEAQREIVTCLDCGASFFIDPPQHIIEGEVEPEWRQGYPEYDGIYYFKNSPLDSPRIVTLFGGKNKCVESGGFQPLPITDYSPSGWWKPVNPMNWENYKKKANKLIVVDIQNDFTDKKCDRTITWPDHCVKGKKKKKESEIQTVIITKMMVDDKNPQDYIDKLEHLCNEIAEVTGEQPDVYGEGFTEDMEGKEFVGFMRKKKEKK